MATAKDKRLNFAKMINTYGLNSEINLNKGKNNNISKTTKKQKQIYDEYDQKLREYENNSKIFDRINEKSKQYEI